MTFIFSSVQDVLKGANVAILQEVNKPLLKMAVSKAASFLGATDVHIVDSIVWDQDYTGRFSCGYKNLFKYVYLNN